MYRRPSNWLVILARAKSLQDALVESADLVVAGQRAHTLKAKLQAGWAHLDWCIARHLEKKLTAAEASAAKLFHTELQWEVCDAALQLHGGAGYMNDYPIARLWRDARRRSATL